VAGATTYSIVISRYSNFALPVVNTYVTVSTYTPTDDLPRNVTLYWRVRAVVSGVVGPWVSSSFHAPNPPYSPAPLYPGVNALVTTSTPLLKWAVSAMPPNAAFGYYLLQVDDNSDYSSPFLSLKFGDISTQYYTFAKPLSSNSTYYWRIRAVNTLGQYSMWRMSSFRVALLPPVLVSPAPQSTASSLMPLLDWKDVAGVTGYGLQASLHPNFSSPFISLAVPNSYYQITTDLPRSTVIYWRVRSHGNNLSAWSSSSFTSPNPPNMLVLLLPSPGATVTTKPAMSWQTAVLPAGTTFASYQLQVSVNYDFSSPVVNTTQSGLGKTSYTITSALSPNTLYFWRVRAVNTAGQVSDWATRVFTTSSATLSRLYQNNIYGYKFTYPDDAKFNTDSGSYAQIHLTIAPGTNLGEKYLEARASSGASGPCKSPEPSPTGVTSTTEVINGISFLHEEGQDRGAGNIWDWITYSAMNGSVCVNMTLILHSGNRDNYPTPPPLFDRAAETQVFSQIMHTFAWIPITTA